MINFTENFTQPTNLSQYQMSYPYMVPQQMMGYPPVYQVQAPPPTFSQFQPSDQQQTPYNDVVSNLEKEREKNKKLENANKIREEKRKKIIRGAAIGGSILAGIGGAYGLYKSGLLGDNSTGFLAGNNLNPEIDSTAEVNSPDKEEATQEIKKTPEVKMQGPPPQQYISPKGTLPKSNPTYVTHQPQPTININNRQYNVIPRRLGQFGRQNFGY